MSLYTRLRNRITPGVGLLFIASLLISTAFISGNGNDGLKIGKSMPMANREMPATDGNPYSLNTLMKDNGLIVVFSCNTCPFVVGSDKFEGWEKQYNALYERANGRNIGFVLINSNEAKRNGDDSMEEMIKHAKEAGYKMPYLEDGMSALADAMGAKTTPHVFAFNNDKKLVYKGSIDNTWDTKREQDEKYMYALMDLLDGGKKMSENSTSPRGCSIKRVKTEK